MGQFFTAECVRYFADTFKATLARAPLGVHKDSGYLHDRETEKTKVYQVVDAAIQTGLYVIIDWHSHEAHKQIEEAAEFFRSAAQKYGSCDNVIYEIWNEPLNVPWGTIKSYAERIIAEIRYMTATTWLWLALLSGHSVSTRQYTHHWAITMSLTLSTFMLARTEGFCGRERRRQSALGYAYL